MMRTGVAASLLAGVLLAVGCGGPDPASHPRSGDLPAASPAILATHGTAEPPGPSLSAKSGMSPASTAVPSAPVGVSTPPPGVSTPPPASLLPSPAPAPAARVIREARVSVNTDRLAFPWNNAFEPTVATHPTDPRRVAVVYQRYARGGTCGLDTTLRISHDGGATWKSARSRPYMRSGRGPNFHAVIAWGPGPRRGSARLYWVDTTVPGCGGRHSVSIAYSDDEGTTWSRLYVERRTTPWVGGFPEVTVDREPASPNYGAVYVVYNWPASRTTGPGMHVIASGDYGRTWRAAVDIPPAPRPEGCAASWRIGFRARTGPDGSLYVSGYQADLRHWNADRIFSKGGPANVCRLGFTVTRVRFDRARQRLSHGPTVMVARVGRSSQAVYGASSVGTAGPSVDPQWCHGLDVDRATGTVYLAVANYTARPPAGKPRGVVRVGRSSDGGRKWTWLDLPAVTLPGSAAVGGGLGSSFKPTLAARDGIVFVGFHVLTDVRAGAGGPRRPVVGTYFAVSLDGGRTYVPPAPVTPTRWQAGALERGLNGPGLRERADFTADGKVIYVFGDGRRASLPPARTFGRGAIYGALVFPGRPVPRRVAEGGQR